MEILNQRTSGTRMATIEAEFSELAATHQAGSVDALLATRPQAA